MRNKKESAPHASQGDRRETLAEIARLAYVMQTGFHKTLNQAEHYGRGVADARGGTPPALREALELSAIARRELDRATGELHRLRGLVAVHLPGLLSDLPTLADGTAWRDKAARDVLRRELVRVEEAAVSAAARSPAGSELSAKILAELGGQADSKTDNGKKTLPDNPDVADLCRQLEKKVCKGQRQIDVAREFTRNNEAKAQNLLREARRYRHLWPSGQKRTKSGQGF
jgi:hypothetical protein